MAGGWTMSKYDDYMKVNDEIKLETDAEIEFGEFLERSGVDCDAFMKQWRISKNQFNKISHYLSGLSDDVSALPPALAAILVVSRRGQFAPTRKLAQAAS